MTSVWMVCLCFLSNVVFINGAPSSQLTLDILHINDFHSNFEGIRESGAICRQKDESDGMCFGGVARLFTKVEEMRSNNSETLLLNAGDNFQGTLWYTILKWRPVVRFLNMLNFSAMSLGNHEFDNGVDGLVPFLNRTNSPILCSNIDVSNEEKLKGKMKKSIVKEFKGQKVGIIGYLTPDTSFVSLSGDTVKFLNIVESVRAEAQMLKHKGVSIIIALGHAGFPKDKEVAEEIPEVDIVIGGHTDTFLYKGVPPSGPEPVGTYPFVVHRGNGSSPALVVQDYAYGKYLGHLRVEFDVYGKVKSWSGNPILLGPSVKRDESVVAELESSHKLFDKAKSIILGSTLVLLNGTREVCRRRECAMGDFVADVYLNHFQKLNGEESLFLALINSGAIRSSIEQGNVTFSDIYSVLPFGENVEMISIKGSLLYDIFEFSVKNYDLSGVDLHGRFLQVSGFKVIYDLYAPAGHKVAELLAKYNETNYEHVKTDKMYNVVTVNYLLNGGDNYQEFKQAERNPLIAFEDSELVKKYLEENSPIKKSPQGNRIRFLHELVKHID